MQSVLEKNNIINLTQKEQNTLLSIARTTLEVCINKGEIFKPKINNSKLSKVYGVFVTLAKNKKIRGCIGSSFSKLPLYLEVRNNTIKAAIHDSRFKPMQKNELKNIKIEISILSPPEKTKIQEINQFDGVFIRNNYHSAVFLPEVWHNYPNKEIFLSELCKKANLSSDIWKFGKIKFCKFNTMKIVENNRIKRIDIKSDSKDSFNISKDKVLDSMNLAVKWLKENQNCDGSFKYLYFPYVDEYVLEPELLRLAGTAAALALFASLSKNKDYMNIAKRAIEYILKYVKCDKNFAYVLYKEKANLGGVAIVLLSLLAIKEKKYNSLIKKLGNFLTSMQKEDGSFKINYIPDSYEEADQLLYPGEALLALVRLVKQTKNKKYLKNIERAFQFYKKYFERNRYFGFVPWQSQAFAELYEIRRKKEYAKFVFEMNDWIINFQYGDNYLVKNYRGGFCTYSQIPGFDTACYLEGIAAAYKVAKSLNDKRRIKRYRKSILIGMNFILQLQYTDKNSKSIKYPKKVIGAFRENILDKDCIRYDFIQHSLIALLNTVKNFDEFDWYDGKTCLG